MLLEDVWRSTSKIWKSDCHLAKIIAAPDADITDRPSGSNAGKFDPSSFSTTVGLRYFFN